MLAKLKIFIARRSAFGEVMPSLIDMEYALGSRKWRRRESFLNIHWRREMCGGVATSVLRVRLLAYFLL